MENQLKPSAKVIADSVSRRGNRLTTLEITCHRFVLAEFNTHRKFSRNSASSRAIPYMKKDGTGGMRERVMENPALPLVWASEQRGMQGGAELLGEPLAAAKEAWLRARDAVVLETDYLHRLGLHKSLINRLLEPWMWHTIICSSTEWANFWVQRCSPLAQPEMRIPAELMESAIRALEGSTPTFLDEGEYHTPYVDKDEVPNVQDRKRVSVARCARVSLLTHDGVRDWNLDLDLYAKLVTAKPPHASPLEHVATPCTCPPPREWVWDKERSRWDGMHLGNFDGWDQHRHEALGA